MAVPVFPVNPKRPGILGIKAYPNIAAVPESVDLAVITTPAASVPGLIGECADVGIKGAIVISAGFKEMGKEGLAYERQSWNTPTVPRCGSSAPTAWASSCPGWV